MASPTVSPDGRWVAYAKDGAVYRAPVNPGLGSPQLRDDEPPLFRVFGTQGDPVWSPDSKRIAFVSERGDHSYIGVYDVDAPRITYLAPGVDRDTSPVWSPDGTQIATLYSSGNERFDGQTSTGTRISLSR